MKGRAVTSYSTRNQWVEWTKPQPRPPYFWLNQVLGWLDKELDEYFRVPENLGPDVLRPHAAISVLPSARAPSVSKARR